MPEINPLACLIPVFIAMLVLNTFLSGHQKTTDKKRAEAEALYAIPGSEKKAGVGALPVLAVFIVIGALLFRGEETRGFGVLFFVFAAFIFFVYMPLARRHNSGYERANKEQRERIAAKACMPLPVDKKRKW